MSQIVKIISIDPLTHDVIRLRLEKPEGYTYIPGQAADIAIQKPGWEKTKSCFTFTSLPSEDFLEFVIKTYPSRKRVTNELLSLSAGDQLALFKPFGDIRNKGEGIFIAGGAGITPFLAILKELKSEGKVGNSKLIFANKTKEDIILKDYFEELLGDNFINILSDEKVEGYEEGYVNSRLIEKHSSPDLKYYYLCGPKPMMDAVEKHLEFLKVDPENIIKEGF